MYCCYEIPHRAYRSFSDLKVAVQSYPFKGGLCRDLPAEDTVTWKPANVDMRRSFDSRCLAEKEFEDVTFREVSKIVIGMCPNGSDNYITLYRG